MASLALSYSDALYEIAVEEAKTEAFLTQLSLISEQMQKHPDFFRIMTHPKIPKDQKKQTIEMVFHQSIDHTMLNFLKLLIDKGRFQSIAEITKEYAKRYRKENNIVVAYGKSAKKLSAKEQKRLCGMLEKKLSKRVELRLSIEPELLAGIRIKVNDVVLDYTALGQLENLKHLASAADQRKESECEGE